MKKIIIYYHVAGFGEWKSIFVEQSSLIKTSGLYDKCEEVRVSFLGQNGDLDAYVEDKFRIVYSSENIQEYEHPTINKLLSDAKKINEEYYILYIHTKGCSDKSVSGIKGQYYWRQMMNYWMIKRHGDCITSLDNGFSTCGINSMPRNKPTHYSGNFWWASSNYVKKLNPIEGGFREKAEFFIINQEETKKHRHISLFGPYIPSANYSGLYATKMLEPHYNYFNINIF